jgi:uncharacterized protein (DUF1501 family)
MNRREFLSTNISLGLGMMGLLSPFKPLLASSAITNKKIIVLTLTGANDGANAFPPFTEQNYYDIRPTIAIKAADAFNLNGTLGMHPALSGLQTIWNNGDMALFPATHCGANPNRSHFYQFDFYARGDYTTTSYNDGKGFLARFIDAKYSSSSGIEALDFSGGLKSFNASNIPVLIMPNPSSISFGYDKTLSNSVVEQLKNFNTTQTRSGVANDYKTTQDILFERITTLENMSFSTTSGFSTLKRKLTHAVDMFRNLPELDLVQIVKGGWDTHSAQGGNDTDGRHYKLLKDVGDSIKATYDSLTSAEKNNVLILVTTEFGRTAHENGSEGTDHGHASAWFAVGGGVQNQFIDTWPGFKITDLVDGRYTAQATDYRDIYAEAFKWAGLTETQAASCFPEYSYHQVNSSNGYLNHS